MGTLLAIGAAAVGGYGLGFLSGSVASENIARTAEAVAPVAGMAVVGSMGLLSSLIDTADNWFGEWFGTDPTQARRLQVGGEEVRLITAELVLSNSGPAIFMPVHSEDVPRYVAALARHRRMLGERGPIVPKTVTGLLPAFAHKGVLMAALTL